MSVEERLYEMEKSLTRLEEIQDQRWESYKRLLNGFLRALGEDIEKEEG